MFSTSVSRVFCRGSPTGHIRASLESECYTECLWNPYSPACLSETSNDFITAGRNNFGSSPLRLEVRIPPALCDARVCLQDMSLDGPVERDRDWIPWVCPLPLCIRWSVPVQDSVYRACTKRKKGGPQYTVLRSDACLGSRELKLQLQQLTQKELDAEARALQIRIDKATAKLKALDAGASFRHQAAYLPEALSAVSMVVFKCLPFHNWTASKPKREKRANVQEFAARETVEKEQPSAKKNIDKIIDRLRFQSGLNQLRLRSVEDRKRELSVYIQQLKLKLAVMTTSSLPQYAARKSAKARDILQPFRDKIAVGLKELDVRAQFGLLTLIDETQRQRLTQLKAVTTRTYKRLRTKQGRNPDTVSRFWPRTPSPCTPPLLQNSPVTPVRKPSVESWVDIFVPASVLELVYLSFKNIRRVPVLGATTKLLDDSSTSGDKSDASQVSVNDASGQGGNEDRVESTNLSRPASSKDGDLERTQDLSTSQICCVQLRFWAVLGAFYSYTKAYDSSTSGDKSDAPQVSVNDASGQGGMNDSANSANPSQSTSSKDGGPERTQDPPTSQVSQTTSTSRVSPELSVGVYSTLRESPDGQRHILYCYGLDFQHILLVGCASPDPATWETVVRQWVREHGSPASLDYDRNTITESMLGAICAAANRPGSVGSTDGGHQRFQRFLSDSVRFVDATSWHIHLPLILQTLRFLCNCGSLPFVADTPFTAIASPVVSSPAQPVVTSESSSMATDHHDAPLSSAQLSDENLDAHLNLECMDVLETSDENSDADLDLECMDVLETSDDHLDAGLNLQCEDTLEIKDGQLDEVVSQIATYHDSESPCPSTHGVASDLKRCWYSSDRRVVLQDASPSITAANEAYVTAGNLSKLSYVVDAFRVSCAQFFSQCWACSGQQAIGQDDYASEATRETSSQSVTATAVISTMSTAAQLYVQALCSEFMPLEDLGCVSCQMQKGVLCAQHNLIQRVGRLYACVRFTGDGSVAIHPPCEGRAALCRAMDLDVFIAAESDAEITLSDSRGSQLVYAESIQQLRLLLGQISTPRPVDCVNGASGHSSLSSNGSGIGSGTGSLGTKGQPKMAVPVVGDPLYVDVTDSGRHAFGEMVQETAQAVAVQAASRRKQQTDAVSSSAQTHAVAGMPAESSQPHHDEASRSSQDSVTAQLLAQQQLFVRMHAEMQQLTAELARSRQQQQDEEAARSKQQEEQRKQLLAQQADVLKSQVDVQEKLAKLELTNIKLEATRQQQQDEEAARSKQQEEERKQLLVQQAYVLKSQADVQEKLANLEVEKFKLEEAQRQHTYGASR